LEVTSEGRLRARYPYPDSGKDVCCPRISPQRAVKAALDAWFQEVKRAKWKNSSDVKASYASASIIGADRVVFNIKGNAYRLVAAVDYGRAIVFIKWLGTHKEYDAVDVRTIQYAR
jgi:mRNA interferase HigB